MRLRSRLICYDASRERRSKSGVSLRLVSALDSFPATKAQPKEMLPLVDKPIIQYGVEEAVGRASRTSSSSQAAARTPSKITSTSRSNSRRFSRLAASATSSTKSGRFPTSSTSRTSVKAKRSDSATPVLVTRELVGDEPFAVLLADDVIDANPPAIQQLIDVFERLEGPGARRRTGADARTSRATASSPVEPNAKSRSGRLSGARSGGETAAGRGAIGSGDYRSLRAHARYLPGAGRHQERRTGEIQLTNGLRELLKSRPIYACEVNGVRHDTGNKLGYPEGDGVFCDEAARSGRAVRGVSRGARPSDGQTHRAAHSLDFVDRPWPGRRAGRGRGRCRASAGGRVRLARSFLQSSFSFVPSLLV